MMPSALGAKSVACVVVSCLVLGTLPALAQAPSAPAPEATVSVPPPAAAPPPAMAPPPAAPPPEAMPPAPPEAAPAPPPSAAPPIEPMPAELPTSAPPADAPPPASKVPAYVLWGLGGASLIVGGAFGIAALSEKSHFDDAPTYGKANAVHSDTVASDIGLGLGVVLAASGTIFYFMKDSDSGTAQQAKHKGQRFANVSVEPIIGQKTGGGTVTLKF